MPRHKYRLVACEDIELWASIGYSPITWSTRLSRHFEASPRTASVARWRHSRKIAPRATAAYHLRRAGRQYRHYTTRHFAQMGYAADI